MRSSLSKLGRVQGTLAQRGIAVKFVESWLDGEIVQRSAVQIGWYRNLAILRCFMIILVAVTAIEKNCKELVV
jgi:hypothetical protein